MQSGQKLLEVDNLSINFTTEDGIVPAVDKVSFYVDRGESLGIVGESGCGKSATAMGIMRLIKYPGKIAGGKVYFNGSDLVGKKEYEMQGVRGNLMSIIFQEPMTSLNPVFRVGNQIAEVVQKHKRENKKTALERAKEMLRLVGIPEEKLNVYPHELSGGMRQRAMIAMALSCDPQLVIADEPTTALDVTIQAQILDLMKRLKEEMNMGIILITHDLGIVAEMVQRIGVMYAGRVVEEAKVKELYKNPLHPYARGLLMSIPKAGKSREKLYVIPGRVPHPLNLPVGCKFHPRCSYAFDKCEHEEPPMISIDKEHHVKCWLYENQ